MAREKVLVIGGGAAGMLASILLAERGFLVHVFEKNEKLGKKLFITGKGRCNLTNACETVEDLLHKFEEASGEEFANDRMMLAK